MDKGFVVLDDLGAYKVNVDAILKHLSENDIRDTNPEVKLFADWWGWAYRKAKGEGYMFSFSNDMPIIRQLLEQQDLDSLKYRAMMYLKDRPYPSLRDFRYNVNRYVPSEKFKQKAKEYLKGE
jgi:hypothetical protein